MIKMPEKIEYIRFKNYERKTKPLFMIYVDFRSILVLEDDKKQNPDELSTNKYHKVMPKVFPKLWIKISLC